jgi:GMP synthase (glutamine-hydrolysing)
MILILDCGSSKTQYIEEAIDEFSDFKTVPILNFTNDDLQNITGLVISGAPILITEQNISAYLEKILWIKETKIPVLGICFGHQLIGITFGAYCARMREDRDWQTVEVFEECPLFEKLPTEFEVMEDHCETVSIPAGFKLIAASDVCVNEAMQHSTLPIFGVQFHPEVSGNFGRVIFDNFTRICLGNQ